MRHLILSRRRGLYSTRRLKEEIQKAGHEAMLVDPLKCVLSISSGQAKVLHNGRELQDIAVCLPRVGMLATDYVLSVLRHLDLMSVPCVNHPDAIARSRNKLGCLQLLATKNIRVPDTLMARSPRHLRKLIELLGGTPVVMKLLKGTQGTGVILSESALSAESMLEAIWSLGEDILIQRFVAESQGRDLRILVLGGEVCATMRRIARQGEFRSNIHRGGVGVPIKLPREYRRIAIAAVEAIGLELAGVDILESKEGPLVIEVNASPGFQGLEEATGRNIAKRIVDFAVRRARRMR